HFSPNRVRTSLGNEPENASAPCADFTREKRWSDRDRGDRWPCEGRAVRAPLRIWNRRSGGLGEHPPCRIPPRAEPCRSPREVLQTALPAGARSPKRGRAHAALRRFVRA